MPLSRSLDLEPALPALSVQVLVLTKDLVPGESREQRESWEQEDKKEIKHLPLVSCYRTQDLSLAQEGGPRWPSTRTIPPAPIDTHTHGVERLLWYGGSHYNSLCKSNVIRDVKNKKQHVRRVPLGNKALLLLDSWSAKSSYLKYLQIAGIRE